MSGGQKLQSPGRSARKCVRLKPLTEAEVLALPASVGMDDMRRALNKGRPAVTAMLNDPASGLVLLPGTPRRCTRRSLLQVLGIPIPEDDPLASPARVAS